VPVLLGPRKFHQQEVRRRDQAGVGLGHRRRAGDLRLQQTPRLFPQRHQAAQHLRELHLAPQPHDRVVGCQGAQHAGLARLQVADQTVRDGPAGRGQVVHGAVGKGGKETAEGPRPVIDEAVPLRGQESCQVCGHMP
jgi:hypothetical protein